MARMFNYFAIFAALFLALAAQAFTGASATETKMEFDHFVIMGKSLPTADEARGAIEEQLDFMFGPMQFDTYVAAPKGDHHLAGPSVYDPQTKKYVISPNTRIKFVLGPGNLYEAHYSFSGTVLVHNRPKNNADEIAGIYKFVLPFKVSRLLNRAYKTTPSPCTDSYYQDPGDFWYFWAPLSGYYPGCEKILKQGRDYQVISARIERIPNTGDIQSPNNTSGERQSSYPDYARLPDANKEIHIYLLMGLDSPESLKDPLTSENNPKDDENAKVYRELRNSLLNDYGFSEHPWSLAEVDKEIGPGTEERRPFVESFKKDYNGNRVSKIKVTMFFGRAGIDEDSTAFHYFFKKAVAEGSIVIFDGHSGLGGNLNLPRIERMEHIRFMPNKDQYQIYFFNSCSSFSYYNKMFFGRKHTVEDPHGTKNLDIITTGLETAFGPEADLNLINAVDVWARTGNATSYRTLIKRLDNDNLSGVNGDDEGNPIY